MTVILWTVVCGNVKWNFPGAVNSGITVIFSLYYGLFAI